MDTVLLALLSGAVIGFCLGALGGGGGILVWPALVFGVGVSVVEASVLAKIIVGSCALSAGILHWRRGTIDLRAGVIMASLGMVGAVLGVAVQGALHQETAERLMVLVLSVLMVVVSLLMLKKGLKDRGIELRQERDDSGAPAVSIAAETATRTSQWSRRVLFVLASLGIGFVTGFLGVGGGFMIVPTLVLVFDTPMLTAAGTSLVVIGLNCAAGLAATPRLQDARWDVALLFAISSIAASAVSVRLASRTQQSTLQIAFSGLIVVLGAMMLWKISQ